VFGCLCLSLSFFLQTFFVHPFSMSIICHHIKLNVVSSELSLVITVRVKIKSVLFSHPQR
jgi:hypothetical protein